MRVYKLRKNCSRQATLPKINFNESQWILHSENLREISLHVVVSLGRDGSYKLTEKHKDAISTFSHNSQRSKNKVRMPDDWFNTFANSARLNLAETIMQARQSTAPYASAIKRMHQYRSRALARTRPFRLFRSTDVHRPRERYLYVSYQNWAITASTVPTWFQSRKNTPAEPLSSPMNPRTNVPDPPCWYERLVLIMSSLPLQYAMCFRRTGKEKRELISEEFRIRYREIR